MEVVRSRVMNAGKVDGVAPVTLKALAAHLGLSHSTVSRALSDSESISPETKARVRKAARDFSYVANSGARLMRAGHSPVIGLLVPDITNEFYAAVARILAEECSERGRPLVLSVSEDDPQRELGLVQALLEARPAALVVTLTASPRKETLALLNGGVSVLQFLRFDPRVRGPSMIIDDYTGGRLATNHLLKLGHTRIGFIGAPKSFSTGAERLRGFRSAVKERGLDTRPEYEKLLPPNPENGARAFRELMAMKAAPRAIFVSSPQLAVGLAQAVQESKVRVPADVSLVAYGNSSWFSFFAGGLTTVSLPLHELATVATSIVFRELKTPVGEAASTTKIALAPVLIERSSTGKMRA